MAVGTALLGSALIGGAASVASGNRAASAATQGAQAGADAQLQAAREANALQQYFFNTARADSAPWRAAGVQALGNLQGFMGMTPTSAPTSFAPGANLPPSVSPGYTAPTGTPNSGYGGTPTPVSGAPGGAMQGGGTANPSYASATPWMQPNNLTWLSDVGPGTTRASGAALMPVGSQQMEGGRVAQNPEPSVAMASPTTPVQNQTTQPVYAPQTAPQTPAPQTGQPGSGLSPFEQFLNSTNYQFTADQGNNALSRLLARTGHLGSGRGQMAAIDYNQNMAHSNAIGPYMNQLNLISGLGQNASLAGGNQAMQLGGMMGNNIMQGGLAAGNALAQGGMNRASAYQNTGNSISNMINQFGMYYGLRNSGMFGGGP